MQGRLEHEIKIDDKINELLEDLPRFATEWNMHLKASKKTAATRKEFISKLHKFLEYVSKDTKNIQPTDLTIEIVENYCIESQTKVDNNGEIKYTSDSHQQCVWSMLNNLFAFLLKRKYVSENPMDGIERPKNHDLERINDQRVLLTRRDFKKILKAVEDGAGSYEARKRQKNTKDRDKAIIALLMNTGMRITALTEINMSDIDFESQTIYVIDKGNKKLTYLLNDQMYELLLNWINVREDVVKDSNQDALFVTTSNERVTQRCVTKLVQKYSQEGIGKAISPHKLRAGYCSILYKETGDAEFVRRSVQHANIATTQRYITTGHEERERSANIMSKIF